MRRIVLDTETTGLDPALGHRVIEIGAVEMVDRRPTGRTYHVYLNPEREVDPGAQAVHGLSNEFLADKPRFAEQVDAFLAFVDAAELIIHNAPFDLGFLNAELGRLERGVLSACTQGVVDTLKMARQLHPGQKNNLDALCRRYGVDNSGREYHGALLDSELLAEVWLAMTRGQETLAIDPVIMAPQAFKLTGVSDIKLRVIEPDPSELEAHENYLKALSKESKKELPAW
ncbi:MAG: DNA polymerase III subunit epsilon [Betaproteobacteria bacterium]|nr:DNA polymerase III subunit epsilon [Betaproteobacteria bacterium]